MTANPDHPDLHLDESLHHTPRRTSVRRILGRLFLFLCAISIGVILASDPKVTQIIVETTKGTSSSGAAGPESTGQPEAANTDGSFLPTGAISALSALSNSARSVLGTGSQGDAASAQEEVSNPDEPTRGSADATSDKGGLFSFGSGSDASQPVVSAMPQNRIPVRRAGISN